jgi:endogenous inhibitor of DNA gyrase (YacG/DUF329 family)
MELMQSRDDRAGHRPGAAAVEDPMTRNPCPTCAEPAERRPQNPNHPFCSQRCRLLDLGKWFGEAYRLPDPEPVGQADPSQDDAE